jgi:hypothetical protein
MILQFNEGAINLDRKMVNITKESFNFIGNFNYNNSIKYCGKKAK